MHHQSVRIPFFRGDLEQYIFFDSCKCIQFGSNAQTHLANLVFVCANAFCVLVACVF